MNDLEFLSVREVKARANIRVIRAEIEELDAEQETVNQVYADLKRLKRLDADHLVEEDLKRMDWIIRK